MIGPYSLSWILALGLLTKTSQTGTGMFSKGMRVRRGNLRLAIGLWPRTRASVGDIVWLIWSGVFERGSTVTMLSPPVPSISSGFKNSWSTIGLKLPFSYTTMRRGDPHTMRCSFEGSTIRRTSAVVITWSLTAFLNKVAFRRDNVTFLCLLSSMYCNFSFVLLVRAVWFLLGEWLKEL